MCSGGKELHFKLSALEKTQLFAFSYELGPPYSTASQAHVAQWTNEWTVSKCLCHHYMLPAFIFQYTGHKFSLMSNVVWINVFFIVPRHYGSDVQVRMHIRVYKICRVPIMLWKKEKGEEVTQTEGSICWWHSVDSLHEGIHSRRTRARVNTKLKTSTIPHVGMPFWCWNLNIPLSRVK